VLGYCQETIQEEEEERSCETNRLEEKFREIFSELDGNRAGYIDRQNCCTENIND
jgi:Ca2+-binding EF-hand superfamily protein